MDSRNESFNETQPLLDVEDGNGDFGFPYAVESELRRQLHDLEEGNGALCQHWHHDTKHPSLIAVACCSDAAILHAGRAGAAAPPPRTAA